jgi:quinol monooxygenase YgiN
MADLELWRLRGVTADVIAKVRKVSAGNGYSDVSLELRIEQAGEFYLSEVYRDQAQLLARSAELRATLEAKGWAPITS